MLYHELWMLFDNLLQYKLRYFPPLEDISLLKQ